MNWLLDPSFSTFGPDIDRLYYIILIITGVIFVATEALLIWFLIRYRRRDGRRAEYIHGSTKAEVIWTAVPFVIVLWLALISKTVWDQVKDPAMIPDGAYEIEVTARQFEWIATYSGGDGVLGTEDDFTLLNRMHVPVNRPVLVHLEAEDVIHSFWVPDLRVKQDALPGHRISVWFEITEPGEYTLACAELCGTGHFQMDGIVVAQSEAEFEAWKAERIAAHTGPGPGIARADDAATDDAATDDAQTDDDS
jgi:cytochrome c oxidase subunit II